MGKHIAHMAVRTLLALALFAAATFALPSPDAIVPEALLAEADKSSAFESAKAKVESLLQQGGNLDQCKDLADATIKEVTDAVDGQQSMLEALPDGETCKDAGQDAVKDATTNKENADAAAKDAKDKLEDATNAPVKLPAMPYITLTQDSCSWIQGSLPFQTAHQDYVQALSESQEADANAEAAAIALEDAIAAAAAAKQECECNTKKEHEDAWTAANADNEANQAAWTQAHHMICVAKDVTYETCEVPPCPTVERPHICSECATADCSSMYKACGAVEKDNYSCEGAAQGKNYKTQPTPEACGALAKADGYTTIMFSPVYSPEDNNWGCRACADPSAAGKHDHWNLYAVSAC